MSLGSSLTHRMTYGRKDQYLRLLLIERMRLAESMVGLRVLCQHLDSLPLVLYARQRE